MKHYEAFLRLFFVCFLTVWKVCATKHCVQQLDNCIGSESECFRSVPCHHGECDPYGNYCLCQRCWVGPNCDQYVDRYAPRFLVAEKYVTVSSYDTGILFTGVIYDEDESRTCQGSTPCPCAKVHYKIAFGNEDNLFQIDPMEGQVSLTSGRTLQPGKEYHLVINAFRMVVNDTTATVEDTIPPDSTLQVTLNVRNGNEEGPTMLNADKEVLQRRKRDVTATSGDTVINMTQLSPSESTVLMSVGDRADFKVEIVIPAGVTMDLTVEIFTADPDTGSVAFALCNFNTKAGSQLQPSSTGTIQPQTYSSQDFPDLNDRAILYFGEISASESATDADRTITISFTASLLGNTPYVANGSSYSVVAGASYDNDSYIWVGQAPFTALLPAVDEKYSSSLSIDGSKTIPIENYAVYTLHLFSTYPQSKYYITLFATGTKQDSYSAGPIVISQVGNNYPCTKDLLSYNYELTRSTSDVTIQKSALKTGQIINCDNTGRKVSNSSGNEMIILVTVYIPNDETLIGSQVALSSMIQIDDESIWANLFNVTIESKGTPVVGIPVMTTRNSSVLGRVYGVAYILVDINIPEKTYSDIVLQVLTPKDVADPPIVSVCGFTTSSGANIPFVPNNEPELFSRNSANVMDEMVVNLGKIYNSAIVPGNVTAGTLTITVNVKIEDSAAEGKSISFNLMSADGTTTIASKSVDIEMDPNPMNATKSDMDIQMMDMLNDSTIAPEAETASRVTLSFVSDTVVNALSVQVFGSLGNETVQGRVCRAELTFVGTDIPCINKRTVNSNVNYKKQEPDGDLYDTAIVDLGSVCTASDIDQNSTNGQLVVAFSVELPQQPEAVAGASYTLYSGIKFGTEIIWTGSSTYSVATTTTSLFAPNSLPIVAAFQYEDTPAIAGSAFVVYIRIKIPPQSRAAYTLTMTATSGQNVGICKVTMAYVGYNFPCVDTDPRPGNISRIATTRLNYDQKDFTVAAYLNAVLDFGPLSNLGDDKLVGDSNDDKNTIKVAVIMRLDSAATENVNLDYNLKYTSQTEDNSGSVSIPIVKDTLPTASNPNVTFEAFNGTDIQINVTKILVLKFQVTPPTTSPVIIQFSNPKGSATDYGFCSASVIRVGKNIPCLNATDIVPTSGDTSNDGGCTSSLTMNLGNVCFMSIVNDSSEDWITVEVGMNIVDLGLTGPLSVKGSVTIGGSTYDASPVSLTVDATPLAILTRGNISVAPVINDSIPFYIGVRKWVDVNVTIPEGSFVHLTLTAQAPSADGRAIAVLGGLKVSAAGINVACIKNGTNIDVVTSTSDALTTSQKDSASVDFGYILNTGFTYRRGYNQEYDNQLTVSVEVIMSDHPDTNDGVQFPLKIAIETDSQLFEETQMLTVVRNATEIPIVRTAAEVLNAKLFKPEEIVNIRLLLSHAVDSSAEPTETAIRLFLPYYMNYSNSISANVSISETYGNIVVLKILNPFLFDDIYEINFTLTVDPYDKRGFGAAMTNATTLGRAMAHVIQRTINAVLYPTTTDYVYAGNIFHVSYSVTGEGCHAPLGMENGGIKDCQLSASTVTDSDSSPSYARLNGISGKIWKPALRNYGYMDYLQVDFGNQTRVSRIDIQKDNCCRAPTSILLQYSSSGLQWSDGHTELSLNYSSDIATVNLKRTLDGRMMRILINETEEPENVDTKYVGMRVEFYGCVLGTQVLLDDVCSKTPKTIQSTDVSQYRHFSVATLDDAIFACDIRITSWNLGCFCSADGSTWKSLPNYISNIIGYDAVEGQTFARNTNSTSILRSKDCKTWITSTTQDLDKAQQSGQFIGSSVIAGLSKDDPQMTKTIGKWTATSDGLYKEDIKHLGWSY